MKAQNRHIVDHIRLTLENQVGDDLSRSRRVHDAVAAEAVGQEETWDIRHGTEDGVVVRRDFIGTCPGALGVDGEVFKYRDAVGGEREDLFNEGRFEISIEAG